MGIGHHEIPHDTDTGLASGLWHVQHSDPLNERMGGVWFEDGRTVEPIDGRKLRRLVSAMGHALVWAWREEDGKGIGDAPTLIVVDKVEERLRAVFEKALKAGFVESEEEAEEQITTLLQQREDLTPEELEQALSEMEKNLDEAVAAKSESESEPAEPAEPAEPPDLNAMDREQLKAFARENHIAELVDLRLGEDDLRKEIQKAISK